MLSENIGIVGTSKKWWDAENQLDMVIPGYKLYRKNREECVGGMSERAWSQIN